MKNAYLRFLTFVQKLDQQHPVMKIDSVAKELLNVITIKHSEGMHLTVTGAMQLQSIASPATIHRKIEDLKSHGFVTTEFKHQDRRTKYLVPTELALKRYERLSKEIARTFDCNLLGKNPIR